MVNPLYCAEVTPLVGPKGLVNPSSTDTLADSAPFSCSPFLKASLPILCVCTHSLHEPVLTWPMRWNPWTWPVTLSLAALALQRFCDSIQINNWRTIKPHSRWDAAFLLRKLSVIKRKPVLGDDFRSARGWLSKGNRKRKVQILMNSLVVLVLF